MDRIAVLQELSDKVDDMKSRMSDKEYLDFCNSLQKLFVDDKPQAPSQTSRTPQTSQTSQTSQACHIANESTDCSAQRIIREPSVHRNRIVEAFDIHTQRIERVPDVNTNTYILCPYCKIVTEKISGCSTVVCGACKNQFMFIATSETHDSIPVGRKYSHSFEPLYDYPVPNYGVQARKPYNNRNCNARMANGGICSYTGRIDCNSKCGKHVQDKYVRQDEATYNAYYAL